MPADTPPVISKLLVFALPNLIHFTLHIPYLLRSAAISHNALQHQDPFRPCDPTSDTIHLCPLIRKHGASTPHLDLFLPFLCRDLFLSTTERIKLREAGVNHSIAGRSGEKRLEVFDAVTTRAIINEHRCAQKELRFQAAVRQNVAENPRVISLAEYDEEQKLLLRKRTILRERWSRRIRSSKRLCRNYESWEELCVVAGLGEPGIEWTLGRMHPLPPLGVVLILCA